jgi:hypothetical protein
MSNQPLEISIEAFRRWCEENRDRVIGSCGNDFDCPVARYLIKTVGAENFVSVNAGGVLIGGKFFTPPAWVSYVIEGVDRLPDYHATGREVVEILEDWMGR